MLTVILYFLGCGPKHLQTTVSVPSIYLSEDIAKHITPYDLVKYSRRATLDHCEGQFAANQFSVCHMEMPEAYEYPNLVFLDAIYSSETMRNIQDYASLIVSSETLTIDDVKNLPKFEQGYGTRALQMDNLKHLDVEVAKALVQKGWDILSFNGLTEISDELLMVLSGAKYTKLSLNGITNLTDNQWKILNESNLRGVSLDGLFELPTAFYTTHGSRKSLSFNGVKSLSFPSEENYFCSTSDLSLNGLESIEPADFEFLLRTVTGKLSLDGLTQLNVETAKAFGNTGITALSLNGLSTFDISLWTEINQVFKTFVYENSVSKLDELSLNGLKEISAEQVPLMYGMLNIKGAPLRLDGIQTLDIETATALAGNFGKFPILTGLKELTYEVGMVLGEIDGLITLGNPDYIDPRLIGHFSNPEQSRGSRGVYNFEIYLDHLQQISIEDVALWQNIWMNSASFNALTTLDPGVASMFAQMGIGRLYFGGLSSLDLETARNLMNSSSHLNLSGLPSLSVDMAEVLSQSHGSLTLLDTSTMSPEAATNLAKFSGKDLSFDAYSDLNSAVAKELLRYGGTDYQNLSMPHVKSIDVATANVVLESKHKYYIDVLFERLENRVHPDVQALPVDLGTVEYSVSIDTPLSVEMAASIIENEYYQSNAIFRGVQQLPPETVAILFSKPELNSISFLDLASLDVETAQALAGFQGNNLHLHITKDVPSDVLSILGQFQGDALELQFEEVTPEYLKGLAPYKGTLRLKFPKLDLESVEMMRDFQCSQMFFEIRWWLPYGAKSILSDNHCTVPDLQQYQEAKAP